MIYSKKELYSILSDIENKVNDNIRRNTQEPIINDNDNNRRNTYQINKNENIKRNIQNNKINKEHIRHKKSIDELKESLFKDNNVKESYNKIKNELPINELPLDTMFDFMDGTKVRLTHPYSFSNKSKHNMELNELSELNELNEEKQSNKQFQSSKFQNTLFKDQSNNQDHMNYEDFRSGEYKPVNLDPNVNKTDNLNNIFSNYHHRSNRTTKKAKEDTPIKSNVNLEGFKKISDINKTSKPKNGIKNQIQTDEVEKIQQKLKEILFEVKIFTMLILFRFYNSLSLGTFFVPDEYWQSIEVAHNFVFDYGYLTWEWKEKIRSFSYPLLFTLPYMILKHFNLDNTDLLVISNFNRFNTLYLKILFINFFFFF